MAREKAPAFQMYPRDWDTDINVIPMTYEEEGVYFAICRLIWLHDMKVSSNLDELRLLLKKEPSLEQMQHWWKKIGRCFTDRRGFLHHKRLRRERRKQSRRRKAQSHNGKLGGRPKAKKKPRVSSVQTQPKALHLHSAFASASADRSTKNPLAPADAGVSLKNPTRDERKDAKHILAAFRAAEIKMWEASGGTNYSAPIHQQRRDLAERGLKPEDLYQVRECMHTPECGDDHELCIRKIVVVRRQELKDGMEQAARRTG